MSKAIVTYADPGNNDYKISIPGYAVSFSAQCVTVDALQVGDQVMMADLDNLPPHKVKTKGKIRILPSRGNYTYSIDSRWYKAQELDNLGKKASLAYSYIYSSDRNPQWQKERPLYRKGVIKKIHDGKYVDVEITWTWRDGAKETKRCRIDYMTCDTVAFAINDEVLVKFVNSDPRRPYIVGKWSDPGLCEAYLYCAIKITNRVTDFRGGEFTQSSESSQSSSSSQESKSSESASSESENIKGLDDYYAFIWDPKKNDFVIINDPITELPIPMPCRADRLETWLLGSNDVQQTTMTNRRAGNVSTLWKAGWGRAKQRFLDGNWRDFIECLDRNKTEITIGGSGGYYHDDCTPLDNCTSPGDCAEDYWVDYYKNIWSKCGTYESGVINKSNPLTGVTDAKSFAVTRTCTVGGGDERLVVAGSSLNGVLIPATLSNHDMFSSYIHELDGYEIETITLEDVNYNHGKVLNGGASSDIYNDVEYSTLTFLGNLHNNWSIREFEEIGSGNPDYIAKALLAQSFVVGRRCASGTFVWLGIQGYDLRIANWSDPIVENWTMENKHNYALAYCDTGQYGEDPFTAKGDNTAISDAIKEMIDKFYEEDPGGAVLEFEIDAKWVSGPTESYSSISSSSLSSSSLSSSSSSTSKESKSSSSDSSYSSLSSSSSESIP